MDLGVSPNLKDARGLTPLYYCVANGGTPVLTEMLLQERAIIGAQDEQGWAEIHQVTFTWYTVHLMCMYVQTRHGQVEAILKVTNT